eukprot:160504-Hanusia_phi.AAC.2
MGFGGIPKGANGEAGSVLGALLLSLTRRGQALLPAANDLRGFSRSKPPPLLLLVLSPLLSSCSS